MQIQVKKAFLRNRDRYEAGETRVVDAELGAHAIKHGWAVEVGQPAADVAATGEATLDIHNGRIGVGDRHG